MNNSRWSLVRRICKLRLLVQSFLTSTGRTSSCSLTFRKSRSQPKKKTSWWSQECPRDSWLASLIWAVQIETQRLSTIEKLLLVRGLTNQRMVSVQQLCPRKDLQKELGATLCHHRQQAEVGGMLLNGQYLELRLLKGLGNPSLLQPTHLRPLKSHCRQNTRLCCHNTKRTLQSLRRTMRLTAIPVKCDLKYFIFELSLLKLKLKQ